MVGADQNSQAVLSPSSGPVGCLGSVGFWTGERSLSELGACGLRAPVVMLLSGGLGGLVVVPQVLSVSGWYCVNVLKRFLHPCSGP